jgi:hypothetical protein
MGIMDRIFGGEGMGSTMTLQEREDFARLDQLVTDGVKAAIVVRRAGEALGEIRDRQLYRAVADSWDDYLKQHSLTRRRADQMVAAAAALGAVENEISRKTGTAVPRFEEITERTARELVSLDVQDAAEAVLEAASDPAGLTPATIRKAAAKRRKPKGKALKIPKPIRLKVPGAIVTVTFNGKGAATGFDVQAAIQAALEAHQNRQATAAA